MEEDTFLMLLDLVNDFNQEDRNHVFKEVEEHFPEMGNDLE